jgi:peptidoglycan hydrolase-like protein with peptidoglycan-binding domain
VTYDETKHARGKGAQGGQFVAKGSSGQNDTVGFDAKRGTGAGYGAAGGDARVKTLQKVLNNLGFTGPDGQPLKVDGKLGPKTTAAIKRLQRKLGIKADGLVTPALLKQIQHKDHVRHQAVVHKKHAAHQAHVAHTKTAAAHKKAAPHSAAKKTTPVHRPAKPKAKSGFGSNPAAQHPSQSARNAAARKNGA